MLNNVFAQIGKEAGCSNLTGLDYLLCKTESLLWIVFNISLILGIFFLIFAGFKYTTSQGKDWHNELIFIILGIILIISSFSIPLIIFSFLR
ncbi:MAG: hypothetical protein KatS3mg095_0039 [Candidatus Parcubacteria bacterium]|nr:MAG: hypothetical protein KatS3mg095_0039 [Candidatus Parcubacteria bacterium]